MGWKEELIGGAQNSPTGTQIVKSGFNSQQSYMELALIRLGKSIVRNITGIPVAVIGQEIGQITDILPRTREDAMKRACSDSNDWRDEVNDIFKTNPIERSVGSTPVVRGYPSARLGVEKLEQRPNLILSLAKDMIGSATYDSVTGDTNEWMRGTSAEGPTEVERVMADRLEESIRQGTVGGRKVDFSFLVSWLANKWREGSANMWSGLVVDPLLKEVRNRRIDLILSKPVPLVNMRGRDIFLAGITAGNVKLDGILTGGINVGIRNGMIRAMVGKEEGTVAKVDEFDYDVKGISDSIEMVLPGSRKSGKLARVVAWAKRHRVLPKVSSDSEGRKRIIFFPEKKRPTQVLPAALVSLRSITQSGSSSDLSIPVFDGPGVYASIEGTIKAYKRLDALRKESQGKVMQGNDRDSLRAELYSQEQRLMREYLPRPEMVIRYSPSATRIWIDGPDMDVLIGRMIRGESVSGLEAMRGLQIMEDPKRGKTIFNRIQAAFKGDYKRAKKEYEKLMGRLREQFQ